MRQNFHDDKWIMEKMREHYEESLQYFPENKIVGLFLQGSQNYGLDTEQSDVDTKLIVIPDFKDICLNNKPISTTHIRSNDEHTDWKDLRLYMETFRKQNLNFLEILFTPYHIINPLYEKQWQRLIQNREKIAHMNTYRAVKTMKGIALEKYYAMKHEYPSKIDIIKKYGYDGKQISHLIRVDDYLERYINGESYAQCLYPSESKVQRIIDYKLLDRIDLTTAKKEAEQIIVHVTEMADTFCENKKENEDIGMSILLNDVSYNIMKIAISLELNKKEVIL